MFWIELNAAWFMQIWDHLQQLSKTVFVRCSLVAWQERPSVARPVNKGVSCVPIGLNTCHSYCSMLITLLPWCRHYLCTSCNCTLHITQNTSNCWSLHLGTTACYTYHLLHLVTTITLLEKYVQTRQNHDKSLYHEV